MQYDNPSCTSSVRSMMIKLQPFLRNPPTELLPEMLQKLKCYNCSGYLSCPPVYETESGDNICGRCPAPKGSAKRSKLYETLAEMMSFPCKFSEHGCLDVVKFLEQKKHEEMCDFKPMICPIATDGTCEWEGPKGQIYNHCDNSHVSKILHNNSPAIKTNFGKSTLNAYVMQSLGKLYLVHIKVCVVTRKIYYSMRYLGKNQLEDCLFRIDIRKNNDKISKMANVLPQENLVFIEDISMTINFNSLLDVLGPLDEIYSKVSIYNKCAECRDHFKKLVFHADFGWICMECVPPVSKALLKKMSKPVSKKELFAKQK